MSKKEVVIIGGGVAGLSALNRLADLGIPATLIEGGTYPSHRLCGEFFSPECLPILDTWGLLPSIEIKEVQLITSKKQLQFSLPISARSQSRFDFDLRLAQRARNQGATILEGRKVSKTELNQVHLDDGTLLPYTDLVISAGRFFGSPLAPKYKGIKGHLKGIETTGLEMFLFPGGYAGLSPIGDNLANFAGLISIDASEKDVLSAIFEASPHLKRRLEAGVLVFDDWLTCAIPEFGMKVTPDWANSYFIGDAAGTIPPASGMGLSLALSSGWMVGDYLPQGNQEGFKHAWKSKYSPLFAYGHVLHYLLMHPQWIDRLSFCAPALARLLMRLRGVI